MIKQNAVFLLNLLQDVNIVRPLIYMAARDLGLYVELYITRQFLGRDHSGIWMRELNEIASESGATVIKIEHLIEVIQLLQNKSGILIAGSESSLKAHQPVHEIFRMAPASFIKITLQHGFECVGFKQSRQHNLAHGNAVVFAADIVCGWSDPVSLDSILPSQLPKLCITGSTSLLQMHDSMDLSGIKTGLICENLHSVRLNVSGDFKSEFIIMFNKFCKSQSELKNDITLRPHPAGQYVLKNRIYLPQNVILNNQPVYKVNFKNYLYGISAPSSILIDMMLAEIPVAVWRDSAGEMDADNYEGLTEVRTHDDWIQFAQEAKSNPHKYLENQKRFLEHNIAVTEPQEVYRRFSNLFTGIMRQLNRAEVQFKQQHRIMFIANGMDPTLQLCLLIPLEPLVKSGQVAVNVITNQQMTRQFGAQIEDRIVCDWIDKQFSMFIPTVVVFCRYGGHHAPYINQLARKINVPVIYHLDDDLLNVPTHLGPTKYKTHNDPKRLATVRYLLENTDLVYCSTNYLKEHFQSAGFTSRMIAGAINCSGSIIVPAAKRISHKLGYMGFDKLSELKGILPVIVRHLHDYPEAEFHLFGTFTKPPVLEEFGERIRIFPPVRDYQDFLGFLTSLEWDIGICPLAPTPFNLKKSNNKWVEYTSVGIAVIASRGTVYDECCDNGCGILVNTLEEWTIALRKLTDNPDERFAQVKRAQEKLVAEYSADRLKMQIIETLEFAKSIV